MEGEPFERVLGPKIGAFMRAMHEAQGVKFVMRSVVSGFTAGPGGAVASATVKELSAAKDARGTELRADLVVIGSGIIPATEYLKDAAAAGVVTLLDKAPGGVRTDETLKAGLDIYAAGESGCPARARVRAAEAFPMTKPVWPEAPQTRRAAGKSNKCRNHIVCREPRPQAAC